LVWNYFGTSDFSTLDFFPCEIVKTFLFRALRVELAKNKKFNVDVAKYTFKIHFLTREFAPRQGHFAHSKLYHIGIHQTDDEVQRFKFG